MTKNYAMQPSSIWLCLTALTTMMSRANILSVCMNTKAIRL